MKNKSVLYNQSVKKRKIRTSRPRRRPNKMDKSKDIPVVRRIGSGLFRFFIFLGVLGMTSMTFLYIYDYLLKCPYIRLKRVKVEGVDEKTRRELIMICGLDRNLSMIDLNLDELKMEMEKHPWVRSVQLERRFPDTLVIRAEKQIPQAIIITDKNRFFYVNSRGEIFKELDRDDKLDFPVITGLSIHRTESVEQLHNVTSIINVLNGEKGLWSLNNLSEIHVSDNRRISLYFTGFKPEIRLANGYPDMDGMRGLATKDLIKKITGLKKVTAHLRRSGGIRRVTYIDLDSTDGVVVSFKKAEG